MRITSKGQVTIPQDIREAAGLLPNTEVEFLYDGDVVAIVKKADAKRQTRGGRVVATLRANSKNVRMTTDEIMALTRGEPERGAGRQQRAARRGARTIPSGEGGRRETLHRLADEAIFVIDPVRLRRGVRRLSSIEELDAALPVDLLRRDAIPYEAAFLAGKAFLGYRRRGGARRTPLPDFYIGAHAAVAGFRLLTRDARRYRTYFPKLELIAPN